MKNLISTNMKSIERNVKNNYGEVITIKIQYLNEIGVIFVRHSDFSNEFMHINDYLANSFTSKEEDEKVLNAIREIKEEFLEKKIDAVYNKTI